MVHKDVSAIGCIIFFFFSTIKNFGSRCQIFSIVFFQQQLPEILPEARLPPLVGCAATAAFFGYHKLRRAASMCLLLWQTLQQFFFVCHSRETCKLPNLSYAAAKLGGSYLSLQKTSGLEPEPYSLKGRHSSVRVLSSSKI